MPEPFLGLEFRVVWTDPELIEIEARAWNGDFGGSVLQYADHGTLAELSGLAGKISGFPTGLGDDRRFSIGSKVSLRFLCIDHLGHSRVEVTLREDLRGNFSGGDVVPAVEQSVFLTLPVVAASIDRFVRELRDAEKSRRPARLAIT